MEYPINSFASLFAFIPENIRTAEDLPKTIFYFPTRRQARRACSILRALLPRAHRKCLRIFTSVLSEEYKTAVLEQFRNGSVRWLLCTDAAGMGCDIPDIIWVIIYGVEDLPSAFQKGGRAVRQPGLFGTMVWLVQDWAFDPNPQAVAVVPDAMQEADPHGKAKTKKAAKPAKPARDVNAEKRAKLDAATSWIQFIRAKGVNSSASSSLTSRRFRIVSQSPTSKRSSEATTSLTRPRMFVNNPTITFIVPATDASS
ncbi:hypothetical protein EVJ58_g7603 [Rhodofomes roseus]|uniref:ATP-dependent RNA helicase n=1 Tax=Rhodofomes roseus TaxID=34475 RepID=A0A4Y9Y331_9APHY|nr:hypothetical protein EVJ58_g7603 [Rhodofomes roseus]